MFTGTKHTVISYPTKWTDIYNRSQIQKKFCRLSIFKQYLIQYIGKTETDFNVRMKNHREDIYKADAIPVSRHFAMKDHIFNRDASLFIIEQIHESTLSRKTKKNY